MVQTTNQILLLPKHEESQGIPVDLQTLWMTQLNWRVLQVVSRISGYVPALSWLVCLRILQMQPLMSS